MDRIIAVALVLGFSSAAPAQEVVRQETQSGWTSFEIKCEDGKTRYITRNAEGFWARGKSYESQSEAMNAACAE
jgi:hypothetical protein